jgi:hypothetical protein
LLTAADVAGNLGGPVAPALAERVYRHTEGNGLFMGNVLEDLGQRGLLAQVEGQWTLGGDPSAALLLPEHLQPLVLQRLEALPEVDLDVLAKAVRLLPNTEEHWWEAEAYRFQGELLLHLPRPKVLAAESWLHRALDVARSQQDKALELHAAVSLSRLWQRQGQGAKSRQLLAPLCGDRS